MFSLKARLRLAFSWTVGAVKTACIFPAHACGREGLCQNIVVEDERRALRMNATAGATAVGRGLI